MALVASYVLRERTRPTEGEANAMVTGILLSEPGTMLENALRHQGLSQLHTANLIQPADVNDMIPEFIRSCGGGKFLDRTAAYDVKYFRTKTGSPREPTCIALVFDNKVETPDRSESVEEYLKRGRQWEELGRHGDAVISYRLALEAYPGNAELLFRQALVFRRFRRLVPRAIADLKKCRDAHPDSAKYALALADCYQEVIGQEIPVEGMTYDDLRERIADLLETAARLDPSDTSIADRLKTSDAQFPPRGEGGFFG